MRKHGASCRVCGCRIACGDPRRLPADVACRRQRRCLDHPFRSTRRPHDDDGVARPGVLHPCHHFGAAPAARDTHAAAAAMHFRSAASGSARDTSPPAPAGPTTLGGLRVRCLHPRRRVLRLRPLEPHLRPCGPAHRPRLASVAARHRGHRGSNERDDDTTSPRMVRRWGGRRRRYRRCRAGGAHDHEGQRQSDGIRGHARRGLGHPRLRTLHCRHGGDLRTACAPIRSRGCDGSRRRARGRERQSGRGRQ
mmetsp:Transcript_4146/g.13169  ORF Transcript_4146/g.13169 Transcript_4146/m.13169 type:complete len:251 (+) Transcript_4146:557-1309(+)